MISKRTPVDTRVICQKFFGSGAPGAVAGNLPGDLYSDTTNHNLYQCNAPAGTAAPACSVVGPGGWMLINSAVASSSGAIASLPSSPASGQIYYPEDSLYDFLRYNGS